jgi:hypothetical protein
MSGDRLSPSKTGRKNGRGPRNPARSKEKEKANRAQRPRELTLPPVGDNPAGGGAKSPEKSPTLPTSGTSRRQPAPFTPALPPGTVDK